MSTDKEDNLGCLDSEEQTQESKEREKKIKDFLWCSERNDEKTVTFSDISYAIRTAKNKALTQSYFHPIETGYSFFQQSAFTKEAQEENEEMMEHYMDENDSFTPPSWFKPIPPKKLAMFLKLFDLIEVPQIISTNRRVYAIIENLEMNISATDVDDVRYIYQLKQSFRNIDFNEFIYSLASIDLLKRMMNKDKENSSANAEDGMSVTQELLFSVMVLFTVAATGVCLKKPIKGIPIQVQRFFECRINCDDQLSACSYNKLEEQFKLITNYTCSPYYKCHISFKKKINSGNQNNISNTLANPISQHVRNTRYDDRKKVVVDESIIKEVLSVYQKNGCLMLTLPEVQNIPMVRDILGSVSVFEPLCSSPNRRNEIVYRFKKYKKNGMESKFKLDTTKLKYLQSNQFKMHLYNFSLPPLNACLLNDYELKHLTPSLYSKAMNHMRKVNGEKRDALKAGLAKRNARLRCDILKKSIPPELKSTLFQVFDTYNPSSPKDIFYNPVKRKIMPLNKGCVKDPDNF